MWFSGLFTGKWGFEYVQAGYLKAKIQEIIENSSYFKNL